MPLDVLGRTRATLAGSSSFMPWSEKNGKSLNTCRAWDRCLQLFIFNEDCLVSARHQRALNTTLYSVHTARRSYRLKFSVNLLEIPFEGGSPLDEVFKSKWIECFRGRRSRNKVSVGEPAEGSFTVWYQKQTHFWFDFFSKSLRIWIAAFSFFLLSKQIWNRCWIYQKKQKL